MNKLDADLVSPAVNVLGPTEDRGCHAAQYYAYSGIKYHQLVFFYMKRCVLAWRTTYPKSPYLLPVRNEEEITKYLDQ